MPRTLYTRLAVGLVLLLTAVGLVYGLLSSSAARIHFQQVNQRLNHDLARNLVADRNLVAEGRLDKAALKDTFHQYMVINPSIEIYLLDTDGGILAYSADPGKVKRRHVSMGPIRAFLDGGEYPLLGDDPRSHDRQKAFSVTPVPSARDPEGYLYVVLRGEQFDSVDSMVRESYLVRLSAWSVAASLAFGLLAGLLLFRLLTRRVRRLAQLMDAFRDADFGRYTPYRSASDGGRAGRGDEIDRLGETFDRMAARLVRQIDQLKQNDRLRRELVAHVSHDLRTPLASMHGYLETLRLKEDRLSPRERADYLDTALRQSERLTRLVGELFELAQLDARQTEPALEPLAVADLVQDVVQKFRLRAEQRGIRLSVGVGRDADGEAAGLPLVLADIALTERVLDNLIDNAINHTARGGEVRLSLFNQAEQLAIAVSDTGAGIAPEHLAHIFDPFYQAGNEHRAGQHAGLGLAIARRIVELQSGELQVASEPGQGTSFTFSLPLAAAAG